jgi:hypothetical protein
LALALVVAEAPQLAAYVPVEVARLEAEQHLAVVAGEQHN